MSMDLCRALPYVRDYCHYIECHGTEHSQIVKVWVEQQVGSSGYVHRGIVGRPGSPVI